jgi:hypothetical protein
MDEEFEIGHVIPSRRTDPLTSHMAAEAIAIPARSQRARILIAFSRVEDATDDYAAQVAGISLLSCYWKRCSELREDGFIRPTGEVRPGWSGQDRIVCRITDKGLAVLRGEVPLIPEKMLDPEPVEDPDRRKIETLRRLVEQAEAKGMDYLPLEVVKQVLNWRKASGA